MIRTAISQRAGYIRSNCALGKKRAKNYISISAGGRGYMFTYFARIGLLLKTSRRYKLQPVILEQINLNWNKKQNFPLSLLLSFATLQSRPKDPFNSLLLLIVFFAMQIQHPELNNSCTLASCFHENSIFSCRLACKHVTIVTGKSEAFRWKSQFLIYYKPKLLRYG